MATTNLVQTYHVSAVPAEVVDVPTEEPTDYTGVKVEGLSCLQERVQQQTCPCDQGPS